MRLSTIRILCLGCVILAVFSFISMSVNELTAAPRVASRPALPMHQSPAPMFQPRTFSIGHGTVFQSPQIGNSALNFNTQNSLRNSGIVASTGFNGFASGLGALNLPFSGFGAFNTGGFTPSTFRFRFGGTFNGSNAGVTSFGFNGSSLFLSGFNNPNGFNTFNPALSGFGNGAKFGFNGGNGL
jgi:hypothetical protein